MPVDRDEWDQGRTIETRKGRILDFLESNRDKGWTAQEIAEELGEVKETDDSIWGAASSAAGFALVQQALEDLVGDGEIEKKKLEDNGEKPYYRATE